MMWLIDAKALMVYANNSTVGIDANDIARFPRVDAVQVAHAKWLALHGDSRLMCSRCKWKEHVPTAMGEPTIWEYCPSCGARMDGERKDGAEDDRP